MKYNNIDSEIQNLFGIKYCLNSYLCIIIIIIIIVIIIIIIILNPDLNILYL